MKTLDFQKVKFKSFKFYKTGDVKQKEVVGWDTETSKGQCGLLCNSNGQIFDTHDIDMLLGHMTEIDYSKTVNLFYNLVYDYSAIFKCLPKENIKEIAMTNTTKYKDFKLFIIPHKMMKISIPYVLKNGKDGIKNFKYFDLLQFFKFEKSASLDNVSKKYLNEGKLLIEEDTGIDKSKYTWNDFHNPKIQAYCVDDCMKVKKLAEIICDSCETIGLSFNQPYSCATLSMNYVYGLMGVKSPLWFYFNSPKNRKVFEYAFNSYSGGRFEVMQRGTFDNIYEYDVNSMYPDKIRKLQNVFNTQFEFCRNDNAFQSSREDACYAFMKIHVKQKHPFINILSFRHEGLTVCPRNREYATTFVNKHEIELLEKYNVDFSIVDGYIGVAQEEDYVYKKIFEDIYAARMKYPKSHFLSSLYKIIMNSFYGKTIEMNIVLEESELLEEKCETNSELTICNDILEMVVDEQNETIVVKNFIAGKYFCPVYATDITAPSRCVVTDAMLQAENQQEASIIGCFTDSVLSKHKLNLPVTENMGDWELSQHDKLHMVGTGVYNMYNLVKGEKDKEKTRTRGFKLLGMSDFCFDMFLENKYKTRKTLSLKQSVIQNNYEDFNVISEENKELNINFDTKRKWDRDFKNVADIFKSQISSSTIII
jgi:hypothetical protein